VPAGELLDVENRCREQRLDPHLRPPTKLSSVEAMLVFAQGEDPLADRLSVT
jgi:hypothetical protein